MSMEENKALIRRLAEAWTNKDSAAAIDEMNAGDIRWHGFEQYAEGSEAVRQYYLDQFDLYSDRHYTIEDMIAEGGKVVVKFLFRGTRFSGEQELATGINIYRISEGKIQEIWFVWQDGQAAPPP